MSLLKLTSTYQNGDTKQIVLNSTIIKEIEPDTREGSPSKAIIYTTAEGGNRRYYVAESFDELMKQLGK